MAEATSKGRGSGMGIETFVIIRMMIANCQRFSDKSYEKDLSRLLYYKFLGWLSFGRV
jgi:hypothetical protein